MAHQLEVRENGEARMFYAGKAPWHKLGVSVENEVTSGAALRFAQLDWTVEKRPLYGKRILEDGDAPDLSIAKVRFDEVPSHCEIVRTEDNKRLGVVGSGYEPIQNSEAFGWLDSMVGEGLAMYHTAGALFGGRRIFISCKMPDSIKIGPDQIDKYLVLITSHDGSMAMHVKWTPIRVVCWNTASAAFNIQNGKVRCTDSVKVRHTKNYKDGIEESRRLLGLSDTYYARLEDTFQRLLKMPMKTKEFSGFTEVFYPDGENEKGKTIDRSKVRDELQRLFHQGAGQQHPDVKETRWAAYNAVTEYADHSKKYWKSDKGDVVDNRMNSIVWGQGAALKNEALALLTK